MTAPGHSQENPTPLRCRRHLFLRPMCPPPHHPRPRVTRGPFRPPATPPSSPSRHFPASTPRRATSPPPRLPASWGANYVQVGGAGMAPGLAPQPESALTLFTRNYGIIRLQEIRQNNFRRATTLQRTQALSIYIQLTIAVAISIACISYPVMAHQNQWPIGSVFAKKLPLPATVAFVTLVWSLLKAFSILSWWSPLAVLVVGWLLACCITMALKSKVQYVCVFGCLPALGLAIFSGAEYVSA